MTEHDYPLTERHTQILEQLEVYKKKIDTLNQEIKHGQALNAHLIRLQGTMSPNASRAESESINIRVDAVRIDIKKLRSETEIEAEKDEIKQSMLRLNDEFEKIIYELPEMDFYPIIKFSNGARELKKDANNSWWFYNDSETAESNIRVLAKDGIPTDLEIFTHVRGTPVKAHQKLNILNKEEVEKAKVSPRIPYTLKMTSFWKCKCGYNHDSIDSECQFCHQKRDLPKEENLAENKNNKEKSKSAFFGKFDHRTDKA